MTDAVVAGAPPPPPGLGRSVAVQAIGTLLSRLTGFGRNFALAYALGATRLTDTYNLANNTPNMIYELALGGVLSGMVLPEFVRLLRSDDEQDGWRAVSAVCTLALVAALVVSLLFVVVAPQVVAVYSSRLEGDARDDQVAVATALLRLFAPQVLFYGVVSISTALLTAQRRFAAPKFAPVLNNLVVIALFLSYPSVIGTRSLADVRDRPAAILFLGGLTTLGVAAMAVAQVPWRTLRDRVRWVWAPRHPAVRRIVRISGWTVGFVALNQITLVIVYRLANAEAGALSAYLFALVIFLLPHGVVSVSIITALQPELADRWAAGDRDGFRDHLSTGIRTIVAVIAPAAVGYVLLARPLVALLLEHGALSANSAQEVARVLQLLAVGLPAFSVWLFLTATYQAVQDTRSLFFLYLVENGINVVAALALFPVLGVRGLGLAYALAYIGGSAVALVHLRRRAGGVDGRRILASVSRTAVATAAMAAVVAAIGRAVGSDEGIGALARAGVGTVAGVTVYLIGARVAGVREVRALLSMGRSHGR